MSAADIAKQAAYSAGQLIAAVKAESSEDNVILGHIRSTLGDLGVVLGVLVDRGNNRYGEASPRIVEPSYAIHGGIVAMKLRGRLNAAQLSGYACIHCDAIAELGSTVRAGELDGGALWRCKTDCITPAAAETHLGSTEQATVGIAVSAWLRGYRDAFPVHSIRWYTIDELLDDYQGLLGAAEEQEAR